MGLYVTVEVGSQPTQHVQHVVGAGGDEARRDGCLHERTFGTGKAAHVLDERQRIVESGPGRCVPIEFGALVRVVHGHLANNRALTPGQRDVGEQLGGFQVNAAEVGCGSRAVGQQIVDQGLVTGTGEVEISVASFQRKRVLLQPLVQREVQCLAELRPLWRMHVQVDESG